MLNVRIAILSTCMSLLLGISGTAYSNGTGEPNLVDNAIRLATENKIPYEAGMYSWQRYKNFVTNNELPSKMVCNEFVSMVLAQSCSLGGDIGTTLTGLQSVFGFVETYEPSDLEIGDILFLQNDGGNCYAEPATRSIEDGVRDHAGIVVEKVSFENGFGGVFLAESGGKLRHCLGYIQDNLERAEPTKQKLGTRIMFYPNFYLQRFMVGYSRPVQQACIMPQAQPSRAPSQAQDLPNAPENFILNISSN